MKFFNLAHAGLALLLVGLLIGCGSNSGSDDEAAKQAFNASEVIIDQGKIDDLEYEVREDTVRFINPTSFAGTLVQKDQDGNTVDVNSIRALDTTNFLSDLLQADDTGEIKTHRFVHEDAIIGEIYFKGEFSAVSDVVTILKDSFIGTAVEIQMPICFFSKAIERDSHTNEQLQNDVEDCFSELATNFVFGTESFSILDNVANLVLLSNSASVTGTIKLRNTETTSSTL